MIPECFSRSLIGRSLFRNTAVSISILERAALSLLTGGKFLSVSCLESEILLSAVKSPSVPEEIPALMHKIILAAGEDLVFFSKGFTVFPLASFI